MIKSDLWAFLVLYLLWRNRNSMYLYWKSMYLYWILCLLRSLYIFYLTFKSVGQFLLSHKTWPMWFLISSWKSLFFTRWCYLLFSGFLVLSHHQILWAWAHIMFLLEPLRSQVLWTSWSNYICPITAPFQAIQ